MTISHNAHVEVHCIQVILIDTAAMMNIIITLT